MNELERLLMRMTYWRGFCSDVDETGFLPVADWLEENGRDEEASAVRLVYEEDIPITPGPLHHWQAKGRQVFLQLRGSRPRGNVRFTFHDGGGELWEYGGSVPPRMIPEFIRLAKWRAVLHLLGYKSLYHFIACCAAEAHAPAT